MSSHRVASRAAEQDDGAFGGEEGEGNNKTHAFDRIRRHAAHAKDESGKGTKNVSPESPLTLQSFRGDVNDNVRSHVDPAEEEYERAKYEEEVIKERIRDRESYEKTGKIKSVGTPKKSSLIRKTMWKIIIRAAAEPADTTEEACETPVSSTSLP